MINDLTETERDVLMAASRCPDKAWAIDPKFDDAKGTAAILGLLKRKMLREVAATADTLVRRVEGKTGKRFALRLSAPGKRLAEALRAERLVIQPGEVTVPDQLLPPPSRHIERGSQGGDTSAARPAAQDAVAPAAVTRMAAPVKQPPRIRSKTGLAARSGSDPMVGSGAEDHLTNAPAAAGFSPRRAGKLARVIEGLSAPEGLSVAKIIASTGWLPHTTRAALTGLRKKGHAVIRFRDASGVTCYRIGDDGNGRACPGEDVAAGSAVATVAGPAAAAAGVGSSGRTRSKLRRKTAEAATSRSNGESGDRGTTSVDPAAHSTARAAGRVSRGNRRRADRAEPDTDRAAEEGDPVDDDTTVVVLETPTVDRRKLKQRIRRERGRDIKIIMRGAP